MRIAVVFGALVTVQRAVSVLILALAILTLTICKQADVAYKTLAAGLQASWDTATPTGDGFNDRAHRAGATNHARMPMPQPVPHALRNGAPLHGLLGHLMGGYEHLPLYGLHLFSANEQTVRVTHHELWSKLDSALWRRDVVCTRKRQSCPANNIELLRATHA